MKKILFLFFAIVIFCGLTNFVLAAGPYGVSLFNPLGSVNDFGTLIKNIVTYVSGIIGALAGLMFVIAGILFVISGGNPAKIDQAKKAAIYAAIGAAIAFAGGGLIALITQIISGGGG